MHEDKPSTEKGGLDAVQQQRQANMATLARAQAEELSQLVGALGEMQPYEILRGPETGLVMVRGKIGGGGAPFNLGEATITRTTIRLANGLVGHSYALGRDKDKIRLAALVDALWQDESRRESVEAKVLAPLRERIARDDQQVRAEVAATKVDFFTMVRGDN